MDTLMPLLCFVVVPSALTVAWLVAEAANRRAFFRIALGLSVILLQFLMLLQNTLHNVPYTYADKASQDVQLSLIEQALNDGRTEDAKELLAFLKKVRNP